MLSRVYNPTLAEHTAMRNKTQMSAPPAAAVTITVPVPPSSRQGSRTVREGVWSDHPLDDPLKSLSLDLPVLGVLLDEPPAAAAGRCRRHGSLYDWRH